MSHVPPSQPTATAPDWRQSFPDLAGGDAETLRVMAAARTISLPAGQAVFRAGAPCESYVLILAGSVRVQVIAAGGREALLYRVQPGQSCVLTTCCMLSGQAYPAEGFTETPVTALAIPKPVFDRALETAPSLRRFVFANLGARIAEVITRMEEVALRPVEQRLAAHLLRATEAGPLTATHQEIAADLGTVREVVSRNLKRLEAAGLVRPGRNSVEVLDRAGLERLAGGLL